MKPLYTGVAMVIDTADYYRPCFYRFLFIVQFSMFRFLYLCGFNQAFYPILPPLFL